MYNSDRITHKLFIIRVFINEVVSRAVSHYLFIYVWTLQIEGIKMRRSVPVTTERLEEINGAASDIVQMSAEARGTLMVIDTALEEIEDRVGSEVLWALRNALRNIEDANKIAFEIVDKIEQFEEIE